MTIFVYKASGLRNEVEDFDVRGVETLPDFDAADAHWEVAHKMRFYKQGKLIVDAMLKSLPGGTVDQVMCQLMERHASLLRVPHVEDGSAGWNPTPGSSS